MAGKKTNKKDTEPSVIDEPSEDNFATKDELKELRDNQADMKSKFDSFAESVEKSFDILIKSARETNAHDGKLEGRREIDGGEIGYSQPVEVIPVADFSKDIGEEAFMNEKILIRVHADSNKESLPVIVPSVNGINQPIVRNQNTWVRRKYVEVLARTRTTRYDQVIDKEDMQKFVMEDNTSLTYPFSVLKDPNPKGEAWLNAVLASAA